LGFPSGSQVQESVVLHQSATGTLTDTDDFVSSTYANGPLLSRIITTGALANPMFSISLQRNTIDVGGGDVTLTVGKLPDGISNDSLTWVPVRLYNVAEGGLPPPTFAPDEIYPFRWEIDIDGVYLDGKKLANSNVPVLGGVDKYRSSALIDTGNSLLRGPSDVVQNILSSVSDNAAATLPCAVPHTLSFEIGGKMFPIDPRDFISQSVAGDATNCVADNIVATDPPNVGALFRWSLGDPFMKSNIVAFHYGNLSHPSVDPPRIGLLSIVPADADAQLKQAVQDALANGGNFESTFEVAPTASAESEDQTTVVPVSVNWDRSSVAAFAAPTTQQIGATTTVDAAAPSDTNATPNNSAQAKSSAVSIRISSSFSGWVISLLIPLVFSFMVSL